jgi:hypothetical protein
MGSLKISQERENIFAARFENNLGRYYKRARVVHRNFGDIFSEYVITILFLANFGEKKEDRERRLDVVISVLECHWETDLHRQIYFIADPNEFELNFFHCTAKTFYFIYKKMKCINSLPRSFNKTFIFKARR